MTRQAAFTKVDRDSVDDKAVRDQIQNALQSQQFDDSNIKMRQCETFRGQSSLVIRTC